MASRSDRARDAVLTATVELLEEVGVERLSIEKVASRSGVAKTTIYRHWPTKADLIVSAVRGVAVAVPTPNTGDVRADLISCIRSLHVAVVESGMVRILPSLLDAAQRDPEVADLQDRIHDERDVPIRTVLELAQLRGDLPAGIDVDDAADLLLGPLMLRTLLTRESLDDAFVALVVDTVLRGLGVEVVARPEPVVTGVGAAAVAARRRS
ncbi:MAG: TetR/AcrR family transcriptional regulator [Acidimicrobiales bacterium]|jgi:AcrR family transcriptional regulator|nr:TetR/AcrR family transcriptional regulator [Acidimicrobiales bacterium]